MPPANDVAFDLRQATGRPTGVGRYLLAVADAAAAGIATPVRGYLGPGPEPATMSGMEMRWIGARGPAWHAAVWRDLQRQPVRAYVSTSLILPSMPRVPALPVILDVTARQFPELHTLRTRLFERTLMGRVARRRSLITATATAAADIRDWLQTDMPITIVPPTAHGGVATGDPAQILNRIGASRPYVLAVGTLEPRKNLTLAIRAIRELRSQGMPMTLVLVGSNGWRAESLMQEIEAAETEGIVRRAGYVSDLDRNALYAGASALLMPSIYEGFGIPLLEAMAAGVPCLCSETPTLVEVAAGAALHSPTSDVDAWVRAISRLVGEDGLRDELRTRGLRRAAEFTPEATARAFQAALETMRG